MEEYTPLVEDYVLAESITRYNSIRPTYLMGKVLQILPDGYIIEHNSGTSRAEKHKLILGSWRFFKIDQWIVTGNGSNSIQVQP